MSHPAAALFRKQAREFQRRGGMRGDVLHITSAALGILPWLLVGSVFVGMCFLCSAQVRRYATGPAVVLLEQRHDVSADRAGVVVEIAAHVGQSVRQNEVLVRLQAKLEASELASIDHELDDRLVLLMRQPDDRAARDAVLALRARRAVAQGALQRSLLLAPEAGEVVDLRARVGQLVEAGAPLVAVQGPQPTAALLTALLPGADRPRLHACMPLQLRIDGFERTRLTVQIERVDEQLLGPAEALRALGAELSDAFRIAGPVVLVRARLATDALRAGGVAYRLHHGMPAWAEVAVEQEPLLYAWLPGLRGVFGDVL